MWQRFTNNTHELKLMEYLLLLFQNLLKVLQAVMWCLLSALSLTMPAIENWFPAVHTLGLHPSSHLAIEMRNPKSKFLQWNSGTCFFFFFCSFIKLTTKKSALCSPVHASRMSTWGLLYLLQCLGLEAGLVSYTYTEACEYLLIKLW